MVLSFPSLASIFPIRTVRNALAILSITVGIGAVGWVLRSRVPPATLWMTDVAISTQMQDRTPARAWKKSAPSRFVATVCTPTPRSMPHGGWTKRIYHVWMFNGKEVDRIPLDIHGGRKEGYRA